MCVYETSKEYEERWISAYCRLNFDAWYQKRVDDMSEAWESESALNRMLEEEWKRESTANKTIRVDTVACKANMGIESCLEVCLRFMSHYHYVSIICEIPYESQKDADKYAYDYVQRTIEYHKHREQFLNDYVIWLRLWSDDMRQDELEKDFLLMPDKTCLCLMSSKKSGLRQMSCPVKDGLYNAIITWSKAYVKEHSYVDWFMGMIAGPPRGKYEVNFNTAYFDIKEHYKLDSLIFDDFIGYLPIFKLLRLPKIIAFREEE